MVDRKSAIKIVDYYRDSIQKLLELIDADQVDLMKGNQGWWSSDFYSSKEWAFPDFSPLSQEEIEALALTAFQSILKLDHEKRALERRIIRINQDKSLSLKERFYRFFRSRFF